jgi:hypothetical protein
MINDLEDFTDEELMTELNRRASATREGFCWYCGKDLKVHTCKIAPRPATSEEIARKLT